jgi:hypothetical protein
MNREGCRTKERSGGDYPKRTKTFHHFLLLHHSPSADESRKELLTANLDADQIALPHSMIAAIFVRNRR